MSRGNWGADTTGELKPQWPIVQEHDPIEGATSVYATEKGWVKKYPWGGTEVLVAINNLTNKLGLPNVAAVYLTTTAVVENTAPLSNTTGQSLEFIVSFNEPIAVTDGHLPTIDLITNATGVANVTLTYNVAASDANTGKLVFRNTSFSLADANYALSTLTMNSSSVLTHWDNIYDGTTGVAANVVANSIPTSISKVVYVYQTVPVHTNTTRVGSAVDLANQYVSFAIKFNEPVTISGNTPTIVAQATTEVTSNLVLTYTATGSNLALGNLVFKSTAQDFTALTQNGVFTANSTNTPGNWASISNAIGGRPSNAIVVANTFTVVKCEPVPSGVANNANVANTATANVAVTLSFDRPVAVSGATPTVRAISNSGATWANLTLSYLSAGANPNTLIFNAVTNLTTLAANVKWTVNGTSAITNFTSISNTAVPCDATSIGAFSCFVSALFS